MEGDGSSIESEGSGSEEKSVPDRKVGCQAGADICSICGNPKSDGNGSLTQWIVMCACDSVVAPESLQELSLAVCYRCGKRTREGRSGSISQFIFQRDYCSCNSPESVSVLLQGPDLAGLELKKATRDEAELEVSPYLFPTDRFKPLSLVESDSDGASYLARDRFLDSVVLVSVAHTLNEADAQAFLKRAKELCKVETKSSRPKLLNVGVTIAAIPYIVTQVNLDDDLEEEQDDSESALDSPIQELDSSEEESNSSSAPRVKEEMPRVGGGMQSADGTTVRGEAGVNAEGKAFPPLNLRAAALAKFFAVAFGALSIISLVAIWAQAVLKEPGVYHISAPIKSLDPDDSLSNGLNLYEDSKWTRMKLDGFTIYDAGPVNTDEDFAQLTRYNDVRTVRVSSSASITGTGLKHLRRFDLVSVQLDSQQLSDEGLRVLSQFPNLKSIALGWSAHVTEAGLSELLKLKGLEILSLNHMRIPPGMISVVAKIPTLTEVQFAVVEGMDRKQLILLSALPRLRALYLSTSGATDEDCLTISKLFRVKELKLMKNEITDRGVEHLAKLQLSKLDLSGNHVTDRCLEILAGVATLKELAIVDCPRVSEAAKNAFLEARPMCWLSDVAGGEKRRGAK